MVVGELRRQSRLYFGALAHRQPLPHSNIFYPLDASSASFNGLIPVADMYSIIFSWWWAVSCPKYVETYYKWNICLLAAPSWCSYLSTHKLVSRLTRLHEPPSLLYPPPPPFPLCSICTQDTLITVVLINPMHTVLSRVTISLQHARQCTYNTEAVSYKHCCSGNHKYFIFWLSICSLRIPACNANAPYFFL